MASKNYSRSVEVTLREAVGYIDLALRANVIAYLEGAPGLGKSAVVESLAATILPGLPVHTIIGSQTPPDEVVGIRYRNAAGEMVVAPPAWALRMVEAGGGVVFIDEVNDCPRSVMAALQNLVHTRRVGDIVLPDAVRFICAGNAPEYSTVGVDLSPAFANRMGMHLRCVKPDLAMWCEWLTRAYADGARLRAAAMVAMFHRANAKESVVAEGGAVGSDTGTTLFAFPKDESARAGAWPSPRSWQRATDILAAGFDAGVQTSFLMDAMSACVGQGMGEKFATFFKSANLPDPRALLDGTASFTFNMARPDLASAVLAAVASEATRVGATTDKVERARLVERAWTILGEAQSAGLAEYSVLAATSLDKWRVQSSGAPLAKGAEEKRVRSLLLPTSSAKVGVTLKPQ